MTHAQIRSAFSVVAMGDGFLMAARDPNGASSIGLGTTW